MHDLSAFAGAYGFTVLLLLPTHFGGTQYIGACVTPLNDIHPSGLRAGEEM